MFKWKEYYKLAEKLQKQNTLEEACQRSAVSRAYYFLHNVARKYYESHDEITSEFNLSNTKKDHGSLIRTFKRQRDSELSALGSVLDRAFESRNECDYDKRLSFDLQLESKKILRQIKMVVNKLN